MKTKKYIKKRYLNFDSSIDETVKIDWLTWPMFLKKLDLGCSAGNEYNSEWTVSPQTYCAHIIVLINYIWIILNLNFNPFSIKVKILYDFRNYSNLRFELKIVPVKEAIRIIYIRLHSKVKIDVKIYFTFMSPSPAPLTKNSSWGSSAKHLMADSWAWNLCRCCRCLTSNILMSPFLPPLISNWCCGARITELAPWSWQVNPTKVWNFHKRWKKN